MCGIVGIIGSSEASREAFLGLTTLQHRGQDGAGILTYDSAGFHRVKNLGLVESVFNRENIENLSGSMALGHTRYSTVGRGDVIDVQPFLLSYPFGLGMVHNGNIVNSQQLTDELGQQSRRTILSHSDTEVLLNIFAEALARATVGGNSQQAIDFVQIRQAVSDVFRRLNGSYSVVVLIAGQGMVVFRDPHGIRPLIWGKRVDPVGHVSHMVASENVALNINGYETVRDLKPGEVLFFDLQGNVHECQLEHLPNRHCMFEWVYFASTESEIDGVPVYGARTALGRSLAAVVKRDLAKKGFAADFVAPVPDTARTAAIALAEELGLPYREVLIKNRYIKRTFILATEDKRRSAVRLKLSPVRSEITGKRIILVDDSIVRGTTSRKIIEHVRRAGAKQVFFVSTCPPIEHPCYYGIDFPSHAELIAHGRATEEIAREIGADALVYLDRQGLCKAIGQANPCMACLNGDYPTDVSQSADGFSRRRSEDRSAIRTT